MGLFAPDPNPYSKQGLPSDNTNIPGLVTLPSYPTLSQNTKHHAVLLNLLPDKKPVKKILVLPRWLFLHLRRHAISNHHLYS